VILDPELEWDEAKRLANLERHGLDFVDCGLLGRSRRFLIVPSDRGDELRYRMIGVLDDRVVVLVWTPRGDKVRCISFRRARDAEKRQYRLLYPG
jgi:uncharacterized DUF497 family protein